MKRIKYFITIVMLMSIISPKVYAECTDEELNNIKKETDKIEITYKHLGKIESEIIVTNQFIVTIKNIPSEVYIVESINNKKYQENEIIDGKITDNYITGKWIFDFYSSECNAKIRTINVKLPRYNPYSENELCEGINGDDFKLCNKYYDYEVSYDVFLKRIEQYKALHKTQSEKEVKYSDGFFDKLKGILIKNKLYIGISFASIIVIVILAWLIIKRKRRKVLK